jgi:hypothetical protein
MAAPNPAGVRKRRVADAGKLALSPMVLSFDRKGRRFTSP